MLLFFAAVAAATAVAAVDVAVVCFSPWCEGFVLYRYTSQAVSDVSSDPIPACGSPPVVRQEPG